MKKKAIKIATASVVAASSFAAVAPFSTEAASSVPSTVAKAVKSMKAAKTAYKSLGDKGKVASVASVQKAVNQAKADYSKAKAALAKYKGKDKSKLNKQLMAAMKDYHNATDYIKAVNYASGLKKQADSFAAAAKAGKSINASDYAKFKAELAKATKKVMDQIVGLADKAVVKAYITPALAAQKTVDSYLATAKSVDEVKAIEVNEGTKLEDVNLPKVVTVTLNSGKKVEKEVKWDTKDLEANLNKPGEYTVKGEVTGTKLEASVKVTVKAVAPAVENVSAINAKKIEVKFNKEVNKTTAETPTTYNFVGLTAGTTWTPVLQADGKTVVLTLNNAIANDTTFVAIVNEVETKADSTKKTEKFTKTITFSDTTKPTFTGVTYPEAGTAVLNFSEDLSTKGTVAVYDGNTDVTGSLTITHNANSNQVSIAGLTTDKEYRVVVVGAKDQSSNLIPSPVEVFVKSTVSEQIKPVIESVTTVDLDTIKVKFSEKLKTIGTGVYANLSIDNTPVAGTTQTFDSETNTLTITKAGLTTAGVHSVSISGYKDLSNNAGDTLTKAVSFAASAPVLEKTEVVSDATDTYVVLTFNEAPNLAAVQGVDITGTYTTPENILKTFATADLTEATDISVSGKTMKIKVTGKAAGNYKLTIPAAGISDGTTARTENLDITFTLTSSSDTTKPTVSNVYIPGENATAVGGPATVERNTVYVKYSKSMNSTAVNPDNYTIDGQKVFDSAVFFGDKTLVKLTLKEGVLALSGDRSFQISTAVTGENGVAINTYSSTEPLVENVKPVLSSGVVIDGTTVELTFTEAVADANLLATGAGNDFEVYIDGAKSTVANVVTGATANDNKLQLQLSSAITAQQLASSTITVKVLDTTDGADANGNPLTKGTVITVAK
ncbi:Ig-like domain-containing protein [Neobacillus sp. YIM B02564]|uniref:Ig-like domain-containing protein n=1 Tax=Neobacillus paridis TaxID=2803862 RepID=A0ABS1TTP1_9BACI|nr:Ig-like domain-containing protein [Neobacillus paridis]MBL4953280.1 Ig-like domain-containing protein [Neobacillus paridis]